MVAETFYARVVVALELLRNRRRVGSVAGGTEVKRIFGYIAATLLIAGGLVFFVAVIVNYNEGQQRETEQLKTRISAVYSEGNNQKPPFELIQVCAKENMTAVWVKGMKSAFAEAGFTDCLLQSGFQIIYTGEPK